MCTRSFWFQPARKTLWLQTLSVHSNPHFSPPTHWLRSQRIQCPAVVAEGLLCFDRHNDCHSFSPVREQLEAVIALRRSHPLRLVLSRLLLYYHNSTMFGNNFHRASRKRCFRTSEHVRGVSPWQLRPPARFQQPSYWHFIFCTVVNVSRQHQRRALYRNRNIADLGRVLVFVTRPQAVHHSERPE